MARNADESGWAWFIPLHTGLTSVGIVMDGKTLGVRSRASSFGSAPSAARDSPGPQRPALRKEVSSSLDNRYLTMLDLAPGVLELIADGVLVSVRNGEEDEARKEAGIQGEDEGPMARTASDFSYSADRYAGERWRVIGDAGGKGSL